MKTHDIRIDNRLGIGFGILVVFMIGLVITGIVSTKPMNENLRQIIMVNNAKIQTAYEMKDGIELFSIAIVPRIISKD
jgi:hypothetical protein